MQRNRLAAQTSPYLLQHADNPVDWHPWGEEALALARRENKPILLSVGYSACHWCHVMAHESFEDPDTAALMNRLFVNIKVDREERPDLDKIYQLAQQLITQRGGGWPLTMFLTPHDRQPFFGGTYFPRDPGHGLPSFRDLLQRVADYFHGHAAEIQQQNAQLALAFERLVPVPVPAAADAVLNGTALAAARAFLERSFDSRFGGFGMAPKFPNATGIERCLRHWVATAHDAVPDLRALYIATLTLTRMAEGGIYDQIGGGFARYSVDDQWMIPHFEKMLYDNGQLLHLYAGASLATGEKLFSRIASETADWLLRDMRSPEGGFYSSIDADSEGHEGTFYLWRRAEVQALLPPDEWGALSRRFGLDREPNFEDAWHLHGFEAAPPEGTAELAALDSARVKLLKARNLRIAPARDDKMLTSWNALTIKGLARAGRVLRRPELTAAADDAIDFIRRELWHGRLLATYKDGHAHLPAYLDDHVFLVDALLEVLQTRWRIADLDFATRLIEVLLTHFEDASAGGFFFTADDHEELIHRSKTFSDDSMPSGNGIAVSVLCRMGYLLGETRYLTAAERALKAAAQSMSDHPQAHMAMLTALEEYLTPTEILIVRGDADDARRWTAELGLLYAPMRMAFAIPNDASGLPAAIESKRPGPVTTAYLCTGMTCSAPLTGLGDVVRTLAARLTP